jgi:AraC family transcriptional regulator
MAGATILRRFPLQPGDDVASFHRLFWADNLIVHDTASRIDYEPHCGPLSVKCAWNGSETYLVDRVPIAVDDGCYLVLNHGRPYASFIASPRPVESLAVFFRAGFVDGVLRARVTEDDRLLDDPYGRARPIAFFERRAPHNRRVTPYLERLRRVVAADPLWLEQELHGLAEALLEAHRGTLRESRRIPAARASTRAELYRRLSRARDAIDSDPAARHRLDELARIACMAPHHFLRRFRDAFGATPHRYLLAARRRKTQFSAR